MSKKQLSATELVNTDVQFVSLVKRGANRIPFRITKEDDNMIDLHKIGRNLFKIADPKPAIVGALIKSGADVAKVEALLKEAGVTAEFKKTEHEGVVTLAKSEIDAPTSVLKVNDEVALVVTDLKKAFANYDFSSWSFGEVMATEGYFAGLCTALDVLRSTVANIMMEATSPSEAAAAIGKACDDFKGYMITLTGGLPVDAFKADQLLAKADLKVAVVAEPAAKAEEAPAEEAKKEDAPADAEAVKEEAPAAVEAAEKADKKPAASDDQDMDGDEGKDTDDDAKKDKKKDGEAAPAADTNDVAKASNDQELDDKESGSGAQEPGPDAPKVKDDSAVLAAIEALKSSFEGAIDDVRKSVSAISDRVEEVSTFAKKTDAALKGTVFNEDGGDAADAKLKKSEGSTVIPLIDTAYSRRHA